MEQTLDKDAVLKTWPGAIATATLFVEDLPLTKQFYIDTFGVPVVYEDSDCAVFQFKNTLINLLKSSAGVELLDPAPVASREAGSRFVFTINVEDVDAMCEVLAAKGVVLLNGPMDRPWGIRTASFVDPAGYVWEIAK
jgi:lactoylglutathione lyase